MPNADKFQNRPQARDDSAVVSEDGFVVIDVLANDRGNPQILWSVDQDDPTSQNYGYLLPSGAFVQTTGIHHRAVYKTNGAFDYLAEGETATDTFTYSIRLGDGTFSTATVNVVIQGVNDPASIAETYVTLIEGDSADDLSTSGIVAIDDVDGPESFIAGTQEGQYGTFTIDEAGHWTYTAYSSHDEFEQDTIYDESFAIYGADGTMGMVGLAFLGTAEEQAMPNVAGGAEEQAMLNVLANPDLAFA
ncbi:MAG TPA: VCBS domain-containing protein [Allosphingosinicella sp.]|jgi:VCBS repeat-containing protein